MTILDHYINDSENADDADVLAFFDRHSALERALLGAVPRLRELTDAPLEVKYFMPGEEADDDIGLLEARVNYPVQEGQFDLRGRRMNLYLKLYSRPDLEDLCDALHDELQAVRDCPEEVCFVVYY